MTIHIIDDEAHAIGIIAGYVNRSPGLKLEGTWTDPVAALGAISEHPAALTFLDVDMPGLSGMELARLISDKTTVIFTTSFREFAPEAFDLAAADYLLKPVSYERFLKGIQRLKNGSNVKEQQPDRADAFFLRSGTKGKLLKVNAADIIYAEADDHYIHLHLNSEKLTVYLGISELLEQLSPSGFLQVHRSYLVNPARIKTVEPGQLTLDNKVAVPIGRVYADKLHQQFLCATLLSKRDR